MTKQSRYRRWKQRLLDNPVRLEQYPVDGGWSPRMWKSYERYCKRIQKPFKAFCRRGSWK